MLEANLDYWNNNRFPTIKRIIYDYTLTYDKAIELVKTTEGQVDVVTELRPLDTLQVAQSPFAKVVKHRHNLASVFGLINMRKNGSPWHDVRLRQAVNYAINRADLIRYATKGNGVVIPALLPPLAFGYNSNLTPYPFNPDKTRQLLQAAGYPNGLSITLIASEDVKIQAIVVSKMLEQAGFIVDLQVLDALAFSSKTFLTHLKRPPEQQSWDIALTWWYDYASSPVFEYYHAHALDGHRDWVQEGPVLRQLYEQALSTVDREQQEEVMRQLERHTRDQAYFLFLYHPITLYAVNKNVTFVPYATTMHQFIDSSIMVQHWSVRKKKAAVQE